MQVQDWVQTWVGAQSSADAAPDGTGETRAAVDPAAEAEVHAARSRLEEAVGAALLGPGEPRARLATTSPEADDEEPPF